MNKVTGKILLEETGAGIPNLIVTVYDVDRNTMPEFALPATAPKRILKVTDVWEHLQGDRLGSVLTDKNGLFALDYEDGDFQRNDEGKRPDLMLFVTAPERSGTENCAAVLHVSCGIRQNAGRLETYVIKLPTDHVKNAGISVPEVPLTTPYEFGIEELLAKLKQLATERGKTVEEDKRPFSERYKERQQKLAEEYEAAASKERLPFSFDLSISIQSGTEDQVLPESRIIPDKQQNRFLFQRSAEEDAIPITFEGVKYVRGSEGKTNGPMYVIDFKMQTFHIALLSSPMELKLADNKTSELYNFYRSKRYKQEIDAVTKLTTTAIT